MISLVSLGPGRPEERTRRVQNVLEGVDVVVGYEVYVNMVRGTLDADVEFDSFPIGEEMTRARETLRRARAGEDVALVSSGDVGIYGMGAALFEVLDREDATETELEVYPGVSALNAVSALLGAPLGQDFASISLSDHLTPRETIDRRVRLAAEGDFVIVFYNPRSSQRPRILGEALDIVREHRTSNTPVGLVHSAGREQESIEQFELDSIPVDRVDMTGTLIVGNSSTRRLGSWMYTPRGYCSEVSA